MDEELEKSLQQRLTDGMLRQQMATFLGVDVGTPYTNAVYSPDNSQSILTWKKMSEMLRKTTPAIRSSEVAKPKTDVEILAERLTTVETLLGELTRYVEFNATHDPVTLEQFRAIQKVTAKITAAVGE